MSVEITNSSSRNIKDINVSGERSGSDVGRFAPVMSRPAKKRLPLFSRTGDQRGSLLQRQVRQVGGQRGDRVSLTLLLAFC